MNKKSARPFVKWAGGKRRILREILELLPYHCKSYYEPFLGAGSVFIEMAKLKRFDTAIIGDKNHDLINAWKVIQSNVELLIDELHDVDHYKYDKSSYLDIRSQDTTKMSEIPLAARFIYLNKTCFNGLYRVNLRGQFNTPFGRYKNPTICDSDNLRMVSDILKCVKIIEGDFEFILKGISDGDCSYMDPPYLPLSNSANFDKYTPGGFTIEDHDRLAHVFSSIAEKSIRVIASNSSSGYSINLYSKFDIQMLKSSRNIGGGVDSRKSVKEILISAGMTHEQAISSYC